MSFKRPRINSSRPGDSQMWVTGLGNLCFRQWLSSKQVASHYLNHQSPGPLSPWTNVNWLSPRRCGCLVEWVNFKHNLVVQILNIEVNTTLEWMPEDCTDGWSTLVQVMATSHYLNQWWPKSRPKWVPRVRINNIPSLVQIMAWRRPGNKPLSGPMMVSLLTHICVTRPQWVN